MACAGKLHGMYEKPSLHVGETTWHVRSSESEQRLKMLMSVGRNQRAVM